MVRKVTKIVAHCIFLISLIIITLITLAWNSPEQLEPTFTIALWTSPYSFEPGQAFVVRHVYVRRSYCSEFLSHAFKQGGIHRMNAPPPAWFPSTVGLQDLNYEAEAPVSLTPGPAEYRLRIISICLWNPYHWFDIPAEVLNYKVVILPPSSQETKPTGFIPATRGSE